MPGLQGVDGGVPPDDGQRLPGGDAAAGGDDAPEGGVAQEAAMQADQVDGRHVGEHAGRGVAQQAGQLPGGGSRRSLRFPLPVLAGVRHGRVLVRHGGVAVVEGGQAELPGQGSGVGAGDKVQVVDAGQRGRLGSSSSGGALGWACRPMT